MEPEGQLTDLIRDGFETIGRMRRRRFSLEPGGFARDEVLSALSEWAETLELALTELTLARDDQAVQREQSAEGTAEQPG